MQILNKKTIIFISIIIVCVIGTYYLFIKEKEYIENDSNLIVSNGIEKEAKENDTKDIEEKNKIVVYIAGAIKNEGVYELEENSRITDIIEKAGGLTDDANINNINLAYILQDGVKVYIPKDNDKNEIKDETNIYVSKENGESNIDNGTSVETKNSKININTATQTELETLPGIGPSTATKIINYRKENGKFNSIEELKKVSGIGDSKYNKIKEMIRI